MSDDKQQPFYLVRNDTLAESTPADDYLHPERNRLVSDSTSTETQYFGFYVPEQRITAFGYIWHHVNLKTLTGGIIVWQGDKRYMLASEICDYREFMTDAALQYDLNEVRLENGYGMKVVEPLKRHHMTYVDEARQNAIDVHFEALAPPVMLGDGNHFEQPMHARGELLLRGKRHKVDSFHMRDRSWGKARPEANLPLPPFGWITAVFGQDFSLVATVFDDPRENPEITGRFALPPERLVTSAWLRRDGHVQRIVAARKRVERDPLTLLANRVDAELTAENGERIQLTGTRFNSMPWRPWPNLQSLVCGMRWECEGRVTFGEYNDNFWNDYLVEASHAAHR